MKGNLLNKVWLRVMMIVAVMTTTFAGTAWAQEVAYRTIDFTTANSCVRSAHATNHGTTWTATNTSENFRVTLTNFNNADNSGYWDYIACGRVNAIFQSHPVVATITTGLIDKPITEVDLTLEYQLRLDYVNSLQLYISSDYQNWSPVDTEFAHQQTSSVSIPENMRAANLFYRIVVDCNGSTPILGDDNFVHISKVVFNKAADDPNAVPVPTITGNPEPTFQEQTLVTISRPNGADYVQYSTDGGTTWQRYNSTFTLTKTTTVKAKAIRGNKESEEVSKCFSHEDDVVDCTWNLRLTPTGGTPTANQALWTDDAEGNHTGAVMTLAKGGSSTNVNAHIGNNNDGTYFYSGQKLTVGPVEGYTIVSVEFTCGNNYSDELEGCVWSNATVSRAGTKVTVTPIDGTQPITMIVSAETHVTSVTVHYSPTEQPYIEVTEHEVNVSSAATEGTVELVYHGYFAHDVEDVTALDADGEATWITAELNEYGNVAYSIEANTTTEQRVAIIHVSTARTDNEITVTQEAAIKVTIAWFGYSTLYYGEKNLVLPADVQALTFNQGDIRMNVSHTYKGGSVIPAGEAVVLKGEPGDYAFVEAGANDNIPGVDSNNKLKGFDVPTQTEPGTDDYYYYVLSIKKGSTPDNGGASTVGFYWNNSTGGPFTSAAHKAYLPIMKSSSVKSFYLFSEEDDPTGINEVEFNFNDDEVIYNLAGQRINKMQRGINIINGKKILK